MFLFYAYPLTTIELIVEYSFWLNYWNHQVVSQARDAKNGPTSMRGWAENYN